MQAGQAMLAQANATNQNVLDLLSQQRMFTEYLLVVK